MVHVRIAFCLSSLLFGFLACATTTSTVPKTQLQIRQFQTRDFAVKDSKLVMKACLNVLQDDGYIVKNANTELGLLTATKEVDVENKGTAFLAVLFAGNQARWKKNTIIECSLNVGEFAKKTTVRANFQMKTMNNKGEVVDVKTVEDQTFYQDFFSKVDKGIFLGKHKL